MKTTHYVSVAALAGSVVMLLATTAIAQSQEDCWTTMDPMPTATSLHSASVIDGKIYVIGGTDTIYRLNPGYFATLRMYDPATGTWTEKAPMAGGRARGCASVVDGKIYVIGGSPCGNADLGTVEMYDPATDTWTPRAPMPRARCFLSASVVNGKIHVIGGKIYPSATMVSTVEEYDPLTDTWTGKANMPAPRGQHSACVLDGRIYVIGGVVCNGPPVLSTVEVYDPATDSWTGKAPMPTARFLLSTTVINGRIYAIGGGNGWAPALATVEVYDPVTDTWSTGADIPTARATHSASVVDGKLHVIGGTLGIEPWVPTAAVEVYDPNPPVTEPPTLSIERGVALSWPAAAAGYVLVGADSVEGPWVEIDAAATLEETQFTVTIRTSERMRFYQLRRP